MVILRNVQTGTDLAKLDGNAWIPLNDKGRGLLVAVEELPTAEGILRPGDRGYLAAARRYFLRSSCYRLVIGQGEG